MAIKNNDENNYIQMSSNNSERPAQIPIRKNRFSYLMNEYSPKETDRWIMFSHPNHFVIYDRSTKFCIYDAEYINYESNYEEPDPICAIVTKMRINTDPNQHPDDIEHDFMMVGDLLLEDL